MKKLTVITLALASAGAFGAVAIAQDEGTRPERPEGGRGRPDPQEIFARMDSDGDGKVSKAEYVAFATKMAEERFGNMDKDGDGFVVPDDMRGMRGGPRGEGGPRPEGGDGERRGPREGGDRPKPTSAE